MQSTHMWMRDSHSALCKVFSSCPLFAHCWHPLWQVDTAHGAVGVAGSPARACAACVQAAVAAIVEADALAAPRWQSLGALIGDTQSLFELGLLTTARSLMQAQEEMMALIKCVQRR